MFYEKDRMCSFQTHDNSPILGYCIKVNCKNRAYCHDCILEIHSDHLDKLIQMKKINKWAQDKKNIIFEIQNTISYLLDYLHIMRNIEEKFLIFEKNLNCEMNLEEKSKYIEFLANLDELKELIFSQFSIIKHDYNLNFKKIRDFSKRVKEKFDYFTEQRNINSQENLWKNSLVYKLDSKKELFSDYFKNAEQVFQSEKFNQFILEPQIPQDNNSVICVEIKKNSLIYMGLCCKKICQSKGLKQIDLTKGYYLIGNNGISYSHTEQQFNCVRQEFQFNGDQIIQIIINKDLKKIIFEKFEMPFYRNYEHVIQTFEMPIDNTLELNLCFYLCGGAKILSQKELVIDQNEVNEVIKACEFPLNKNKQVNVQNNSQQQTNQDTIQEIRQEAIQEDNQEIIQQEQQQNQSETERVQIENNQQLENIQNQQI